MTSMMTKTTLAMTTLLLIISALLATIVVAAAESTMSNDIIGSNFCDSKCGVRCSKAGRQDRCLKYCGICCQKCNCVPSGTSGNKAECPCYRDMKNSKGTPKCP
ncbi:hypothetical protein ACS0TY_036864 [Phlomoides rotata]